MAISDTTTEILNDLIAINNERIEAYEQALKALDDEDRDLKQVFLSMIRESRDIKMSLTNEIQVYGGAIKTDTTVWGKVYKVWQDVKVVFSGNNRRSILTSCEYGEDATQRAYNIALMDEDVPSNIRLLLVEQRDVLRDSHDKIKMLRDRSF